MNHPIVAEVGRWAKANFTYHNPWLGIVEEIGELTHCLLKRAQKIRGYDDCEHFLKEFRDAIGDIGVYTAHYCYINHIELDLDAIHRTSAATVPIKEIHNVHIAELLRLAGQLLQLNNHNALKSFVMYLCWVASAEGLNFKTTVEDVWDAVKLRNWKDHPVDADKQILDVIDDQLIDKLKREQGVTFLPGDKVWTDEEYPREGTLMNFHVKNDIAVVQVKHGNELLQVKCAYSKLKGLETFIDPKL